MKISFKSLALTAILAIAGQGIVSGQAFWGIYGGINTAGFQMKGYVNPKDPGDKQPTFENIRRITVGVTCELPLSTYFLLQPELAFVQRGGTVTWDTGYTDITGGGTTTYNTVNNIELGYIQIPILMKWRLPITNPKPIYPQENSAKPWYLELYAGPAFNYAVMKNSPHSSTISHIPAGGSEVDTVYQLKATSAVKGIKGMDVSACLGLNIKWRFNRKAYVWAGVRYSMNFLNINKEYIKLETINKEGKDVVVYPTLKNKGNLAVTIGISTTFTKRRYWENPRMNNRKF